MLHAEDFSSNNPQGACPGCHGLGRIYEATEASLVPDDSLSIRERSIAAWPTAWQGQNLRDIVTTLGFDVDRPWRELSKKERDWLLFTDEQPVVPVYPGYSGEEVRRAIKRREPPDYQGTFTGARRYVMQTFANTESASIRKRAGRALQAPTWSNPRIQPEVETQIELGNDFGPVGPAHVRQTHGAEQDCVRLIGDAERFVGQRHPSVPVVSRSTGQSMETETETLRSPL
jgi:excinuclease ABC subunit A